MPPLPHSNHYNHAYMHVAQELGGLSQYACTAVLYSSTSFALANTGRICSAYINGTTEVCSSSSQAPVVLCWHGSVLFDGAEVLLVYMLV